MPPRPQARPRRGAASRSPGTRDRALVLRRYPYGETSLVVRVLTPGQGRVNLLAKGAYRPTSGYCGVLDYFDTLELTWRRRPGQDLGVLAAGELRERRRGLTADLERYRAGLAVLELAGLAAREGQPEVALFGLVEATLGHLAGGEVQPLLALTWFDLAFLAQEGLEPALEHCAVCGRREGERGERASFSALAGGRLCPTCADEARASGRRVEGLPLNVLRLARSLRNTPGELLPRTHAGPRALPPVAAFVRRFLEAHLETRLRR